MAGPQLSVVVATIHGGDEIGPCLDRLLPQVEEADGEVIVLDATGNEIPRRHPRLRVISRPGESVFAMRLAGVAAARAPIIACTEDHCLVAPDWCAAIVAAHQRHPHGMVAGVAVNGSDRRLVDWANFLLAFSPFMKPLARHRGTRVPPLSNASFKRSVIPDSLEPGDLEIALPERLGAAGSLLVLEEIAVTHVQSSGIGATLAAHFNNGRATAGLALAGAPRSRRARRIGQALVAAPRLVWQTARNVLRRGVPPRAKWGLPILALVVAAHTTGEISGAVFGAGRSPERVD